MGSQIGVALAAAVMIGGFELLRELDWMKAIFGETSIRRNIAGCCSALAMVIMMVLRPRGFVSTRCLRSSSRSERPCPALVKEGHG